MKVAQRHDACGQHGIAGIGRRAGPMDRRRWLDRRVEVVAERGAERGLVALFDRQQVDHRRPHLLVLDMEHAGERLRLGVEAMDAAFGFAERLARHVERLAGGGLRRLGTKCIRLRRRHRFLRRCRRRSEAFEIDGAGSVGDERVEFGGELAVLALQPGAALVAAADGRLELGAFGRQVGERRGQFAEAGFAGGERRAGHAHPRLDAGAAFRAGRGLAHESLLLGMQARQRSLGICAEPLLALAIFAQLDEPPRQLGDALPGERRLALQGIAGDHQALQYGGGLRLAFAQRRQIRSRIGLTGRGLGFGAGAFRNLAHAGGLGGFRLGHLGFGLHQAQVEQRRLGLADVLRQRAVTHGLASLALQGVDLAGQLADHVLQPRQVLLGRTQAQLGLMAPGMQSGNARGLFQHPAALLGLGLDDLADAPLMHHRRRAGAGGGIGEQDLDVARAHLAAVEPIRRALVALDAA